MEAAEEVVVKRVAEAVVVPLSELVQATVRVVVQGMVVLMGTGMQVVEVEVGVAEEVAAVGELEPPGLDQATVQDMDPVLVTGQEVEAGKVEVAEEVAAVGEVEPPGLEGEKVAAAVVVPDLVQGFVFLIGLEMQVAEVEVAVEKTLREVHRPGMDQAMVEDGAEAGEEEAMEVDRDMGQDTAAERMVHPEVEETTD